MTREQINALAEKLGLDGRKPCLIANTMTRAEMNALADRLDLDRDEMPGLMEDHDWVYEQMVRELAEFAATTRGDQIFELTTTGHFDLGGDLSPVLAQL